ncbi:hypothetical protein XENTR_v10022961 [Xenopus tropicalis]|nr:hypothetical protein XENTR_v10022961 [Xenopus tropicalis]
MRLQIPSVCVTEPGTDPTHKHTQHLHRKRLNMTAVSLFSLICYVCSCRGGRIGPRTSICLYPPITHNTYGITNCHLLAQSAQVSESHKGIERFHPRSQGSSA